MSVSGCWSQYTSGGVAQIQALECIILQFLHIIVRLAGLAAFVMIIVGGFKYLTSAGDPKAVESARNTLTSAILGLALVIGSWFILRFIEEFTGIPVTQFTFPIAP